MNVRPQDMKRGLTIRNKAHPDWGTWSVLDKYADGIWEIRGDRGDRVLNEGELRFWEITKLACREQVIAERIARRMMAGPGMSDSAFRARVRRIYVKIAARYGGDATGNGVIGTTADGDHWWAGISRMNASNGEVAGMLVITIDYADGRKGSAKEAFGWDRAFDRLGIPAVRPEVKL